MTFGEQFHIEIRKPADSWDTTVSVDQWFTSVEKLLRQIADTKAGTALFQAVLDTGAWITLQPLNWNECNAHGAAYKEIQKTRTFSGIVKFDPAVYAKNSRCYNSMLGSKYNHGGLPDEVLFHETIHALRGSIVHSKIDLNGGLWRYQNTEEFLAVVITNIYISEKGKGGSGLRGGERGKISLESYFSDSLCFFASSSQILPLLKTFRDVHPKLFSDLSKVKAKFNPIRAMVENPVAVEKITSAKATLMHENGAEKHQKWLDEKRVAELRKATATMNYQGQKKIENTLAAISNASPDEIAAKLGELGIEALEVANRISPF